MTTVTDQELNALTTCLADLLPADASCLSLVPNRFMPTLLGTRSPLVIWLPEIEPQENQRNDQVNTMHEVEAFGNAWIPHAVKCLDMVAALPDNWNDEGSPKTDPKIIDAAKELLRRIGLAGNVAVPAPDACPIPGGRFQFEWEYACKTLDLEFMDETTLCFLTTRQTPEGNILTSGEYPQRLLGETLKWLDWLTQP